MKPRLQIATTTQLWNPPAETSLRRMSAVEVEGLADGFDPISLQEMDSVALLDRVDTKFVLSLDQLVWALLAVRRDYKILTIDGRRVHAYRSLYYDTPDFTFYHAHVSGRAQIYKVRTREYVETCQMYLEVKRKNQKNRTEKSRLPIPCGGDWVEAIHHGFLESSLPASAWPLEPTLANAFRRITLASCTHTERVTIDLNLSFCAPAGIITYLEPVVVAEIKRESPHQPSAFLAEMRRQGLRKTGFSKYCYGVARSYPSIKANALKEKFLLVEKIQQKGTSHVFAA